MLDTAHRCPKTTKQQVIIAKENGIRSPCEYIDNGWFLKQFASHLFEREVISGAVFIPNQTSPNSNSNGDYNSVIQSSSRSSL